MYTNLIKTAITIIWDVLKMHIIDWVITGVVTFFTVRSATKQYYYKSRKEIAHSIMELGLRSMYTLMYSEPLPGTAKVIFVEYGKHSVFMTPKQLKDSKCEERGLNNIRQTITSCGNSLMEISKFRPRDYGVLGLANQIGKIVLFDFSNGDLWKFYNGGLQKLNVTKSEGYYLYNGHQLSKVEGNARSLMIAVPIIKDYYGSKLLGGITFDIEPNDDTVFRSIKHDDSEEVKEEKRRLNRKVIEVAANTASYLKTAYFSEKGERI